MKTPKAAKTRYYFAYGSNCNLDQMERRCPAARVIGRVTLPNYALSFNGKTSGWGVANIHRKRGKEVKGLLWAITPECERNLDRYEGYPTLYEKRNVTVRTEDDATIKAMVYVMTDEHKNPALPSKGYYEGIVAGFQQNSIPADTVRAALVEVYNQIEGGGMGCGR